MNYVAMPLFKYRIYESKARQYILSESCGERATSHKLLEGKQNCSVLPQGNLAISNKSAYDFILGSCQSHFQESATKLPLYKMYEQHMHVVIYYNTI